MRASSSTTLQLAVVALAASAAAGALTPAAPKAAASGTCGVDDGSKRDCGDYGSTQSSCEASGCCWAESSSGGIPWCFYSDGADADDSADADDGAPATDDSESGAVIAPVVVQLFEWSWSDVAIECESFLAPKGFDAVQVSPPMEHIVGSQWWTRYQPVSYTLESRSGGAAAFADMVARCAAVGVEVYADAVINHMAAGSGVGTNGSSYGSRAFPAAGYTQDDFHHDANDEGSNCAVTDYTSQYNVQTCDLVGLPDLCTGCASVQSALGGYIDTLAAAGVVGLRVDAAKHQEASELYGALARARDHGMLVYQEVIGSAGEAVTCDMYYGNGLVTEFAYALDLSPNFKADGKLGYLGNFGEAWGLMPTGDAVAFLDNHDTQRGDAPLTYKDGAVYTLASLFMLAHPYGALTRVMSSYYFSDHDAGPPSVAVHADDDGSAAMPATCNDGSNWVCEHRNAGVANMVGWRRAAKAEPVTSFNAAGSDTIAFGRGANAWIALNRATYDWSAGSIATTLAAGTYCNVIVDADPASCPTVTIGADGAVSGSLSVPSLSAVAFHINAMVPDAVVA